MLTGTLQKCPSDDTRGKSEEAQGLEESEGQEE